LNDHLSSAPSAASAVATRDIDQATKTLKSTWTGFDENLAPTTAAPGADPNATAACGPSGGVQQAR
jgi:hypothetical protein